MIFDNSIKLTRTFESFGMAAMIDWLDNEDHGYRRRYARRPVSLPAKLRIGDQELDATTENISPGGAFLRVALPPSTDEVIASIGLPHGRKLHVRAKVRWRRQEPPGVGVEFETFLSTPQEQDLESIIA